MLTPGYATTATERIIPRLSLLFTTGSLDPRITFTRALGTATRVNGSGVIETVSANTPRFDYDPVTLAVKGLLIEETRTNICKYSNGVGGTGWTLSAGVTVPSTTTAPDNSSTASVLTVTTGNTGTFQIITGLSTAIYSMSCYLKADSGTTANLGIVNVADLVQVDLSNGTITGGTGAAQATIQNAGNGWYRVAFYRSCTAGNFGPSIKVSTAGKAILVWGVNFEVGTIPTSYIPNTGSGTTTRNADVAVMTSTNFSDWWQATTGAVAARAQQRAILNTSPWVQFDDATANNLITLRGNIADPELYIKATTDQAQIDAGTLTANTNFGLAGGWGTNNCAASLNGAAVGTDLTATIPVVTQARLGSDGTNYLNGWLQSVRYWPQRITNAEVQAFAKL